MSTLASIARALTFLSNLPTHNCVREENERKERKEKDVRGGLFIPARESAGCAVNYSSDLPSSSSAIEGKERKERAREEKWPLCAWLSPHRCLDKNRRANCNNGFENEARVNFQSPFLLLQVVPRYSHI